MMSLHSNKYLTKTGVYLCLLPHYFSEAWYLVEPSVHQLGKSSLVSEVKEIACLCASLVLGL